MNPRPSGHESPAITTRPEQLESLPHDLGLQEALGHGRHHRGIGGGVHDALVHGGHHRLLEHDDHEVKHFYEANINNLSLVVNVLAF